MMDNSDDFQRKLEALEAEVNQTSRPQSPRPVSPEVSPIQTVLNTFDSLPTVAKIGAIALGIVLSLAVLSLVLKIVMSVVVIAAIGFGGYILYKLFLAGDK